MRTLLYVSVLFLTARKSKIDIGAIEQRAHGISYIKGTNKPVDGEVINRFDNGSVASRENYTKGKAIGNWYAYGFKGEIVSHGFGVDAKRYQDKFPTIDLTHSLLSINIEGSFASATLYLDNRNLFEQPVTLVALSKEIFRDYADEYKIADILLYDKEHEYTVNKTATLGNAFRIDTVSGKDKKTVFIK